MNFRFHGYIYSILFLIINGVVEGQTDVLPSTSFSFEHDGQEVQALYFANYPLTRENNEITRAVFVVHGTLRNGDVYFENMKNALSMRPDLVESTLIIAPQFITQEEVDFHALEPDYPYWSTSGWASGSTSRNEEPNKIRISSFEVLDTLMRRVIHQFPSIKHLVFTGHSAGGQLTNAYTASSPMFSLLCTEYGIASKSIVANPGKYVYMTSRRRVTGTTDQFDENVSGCDDYNEWSFGLEDLFVYPELSGAGQIREWVGSREITYLLGDQDTDPNDTITSCRAKAQGENRFERGMVHYNHMIDTYGPGIEEFHQMIVVPGVGHNNLEMYTSEEGLEALFDRLPLSDCENLTTSTAEVISHAIEIFPNPLKELLNIHLPDDELGEIELKLVDLNGQVRHSSKVVYANFVSVSLNSLPKGIYFLLVSKNGHQWAKQVIKL